MTEKNHPPSLHMPGYEFQTKTPAFNLATHHNPYATPITEQLSNIIAPHSTYLPESYSQGLQATIAQHEGLPTDSVFLGNGLWHILHQFFTNFAPRQVVLMGPLADPYYVLLEQLSIPYQQVSLLPENDFQLSSQALQNLWETTADLVILGTPNTLTGTIFNSLSAIFSMIRAPRVLIDASLQEFLYPTSDYHNQRFTACLNYLRPGIALFMVNELASFFSCPGICLAYILGDKHPLATLKRRTPPFTTPLHSQLLGERLFQRIDDYRATLPKLAKDLANTAVTLRRSEIFEPNYVFEGPTFVSAMLKNPKKTSSVIQELHKHHIGVLNIPANRGLPAGIIRMSAVDEENLPYIEKTLHLITDTFA